MDEELKGLRLTVDRHTEEIAELKEGHDLHEKFMFGQYDAHTSQWLPGLAQQLASAVKDIAAIRTSAQALTQWAQTSLTRALIAILSCALTSGLAVVWYIIRHLDKIIAAFH